MLTEALRSTEAELEDRCWNCPPALQHWLQLTHELELRDHQRKRADAERQLEDAKIMVGRAGVRFEGSNSKIVILQASVM